MFKDAPTQVCMQHTLRGVHGIGLKTVVDLLRDLK